MKETKNQNGQSIELREEVNIKIEKIKLKIYNTREGEEGNIKIEEKS